MVTRHCFTRVEYILCRGAAMLRLSWQNLSVEGAYP